MNDQTKEFLIQVLCGVFALFFVILIMRELDKNQKWEPMNTPPRPVETDWPDDAIADDTPLDGYGYGHREPDCQVKILDTLKK